MQTQSKLDIVDEKYQQTIIYGIVCMITKEKYVGSTYQTLEDRVAKHIRQRDCSAWQILERGNYKAYVIQHYPCNTLREMLVREGAWQRAYQKSFGEKLVNKKIEGTFYEENPETKTMYNTQYYQEHKEEIQANKKQYYEEHKEERKQYNQEHKEEIQANKKQYYEEHKEEIQAREKRPWTCEWCNNTMRNSSKSRHKKRCKSKPSE